MSKIANPWQAWLAQHQNDRPIDYMHRMFGVEPNAVCGGCRYFRTIRRKAETGRVTITRCLKYQSTGPGSENWGGVELACKLFDKPEVKKKKK